MKQEKFTPMQGEHTQLILFKYLNHNKHEIHEIEKRRGFGFYFFFCAAISVFLGWTLINNPKCDWLLCGAGCIAFGLFGFGGLISKLADLIKKDDLQSKSRFLEHTLFEPPKKH